MFEYLPELMKGLHTSLTLTVASLIVALILALIFTIILTLKTPVLVWLVRGYITLFTGTPLLVQMYIAYFFLPMVIPALNNIDKIYTVIFALVLNSSAYVSEIIRSGITAVDNGQMEAARSLGMSYSHAMRKIIMPQAIKNILPAVGNEFVVIIKESSILYTIGIYELTYQANKLASTNYRYLETLMISALIYFVLTFVTSQLLAVLERRMHRGDR